jgi:hypothetical protein
MRRFTKVMFALTVIGLAVVIGLSLAVIIFAAKLVGWKLFFGIVAIAVIGLLAVAHISLRTANSVAKEYTKKACPADASDVLVYFRTDLFKWAALGWLTGGHADFFFLTGKAQVAKALESLVNHYVYLHTQDITRYLQGKLIMLDPDYESGLVDQVLRGIGRAPSIFFVKSVSVIVTFNSALPPESWAA